MPLTDAYVNVYGKIPDLFAKIRDGQAPEQFTHQLLKDYGFRGSNDRQFIPLLKAIGFLTPDGKPTQRYHAYRDHSQSESVMAEAIREAYADIFLIKSKPSRADKATLVGKFKSFHNVSDRVAGLMSATLLQLLNLADLDAESRPKQPPIKHKEVAELEQRADTKAQAQHSDGNSDLREHPNRPSLHYNIQIHLPSTKDVEVYNAIFRSIKEHLLEE